METPWYVIRMPGVVGGESPRGLSLSRLSKRDDMNLEQIKLAISNLSEGDLENFSLWFEDLMDERWEE